MITKPPILVTGIPRSGTSIIAGVVNLCNAFSGNISVNNSKRRGMYENIQVREKIVKPYLDRIGGDPAGQYPILPTEQVSTPLDWGRRVEKIMEEEGYQEGSWMYKDNRSVLIWRMYWPFFLRSFAYLPSLLACLPSMRQNGCMMSLSNICSISKDFFDLGIVNSYIFITFRV